MTDYPESITLEIPHTAMTATVKRERLHPAFCGGDWFYPIGPWALIRPSDDEWACRHGNLAYRDGDPKIAFSECFYAQFADIIGTHNELKSAFTLSLPRLVEILRGEGWDVKLSGDSRVRREGEEPGRIFPWLISFFSEGLCRVADGYSGTQHKPQDVLTKCREYLNSLEGAERDKWRIPGWDSVPGVDGGTYVPNEAEDIDVGPMATHRASADDDLDAGLGKLKRTFEREEGKADLAAARTKYEPLDTREKCIRAMRDGWRIIESHHVSNYDRYLFIDGNSILRQHPCHSVPKDVKEWAIGSDWSELSMVIVGRHFTPEDDQEVVPVELDRSPEAIAERIAKGGGAKVADGLFFGWLLVNHTGVLTGVLSGRSALVSPCGKIQIQELNDHCRTKLDDVTEAQAIEFLKGCQTLAPSMKDACAVKNAEEALGLSPGGVEFLRNHLPLKVGEPAEPFFTEENWKSMFLARVKTRFLAGRVTMDDAAEESLKDTLFMKRNASGLGDMYKEFMARYDND